MTSSSSAAAPEGNASTTSCPQHIIDYMLKEASSQTDRQYQKMELIESAKSAQQQVWIVKLLAAANTSTALADKYDKNLWNDCLQSGQNHMVVRLWKGGSQWWNLHRNQNPKLLAKSELLGYRLARQAFEQEEENETIRIPRVLYVHPPENNIINNNNNSAISSSWAIFEYVGPRSTLFDSKHQYDDSHLNGMIQVRHEFGFDEPHPRWGRVPVDEALDYAKMVLHQVVLPLQRKSGKLLLQDNNASSSPPKTYQSMLQLYQQAYWQDLKPTLEKQLEKDEDHRTLLTQTLGLLEHAVTTVLPNNISYIPPLPPVLVHLDLQPQNLLFAKTTNGDKISVSSVLDWEDAAIADPRFELLLLGRKVCANREQAEELWKLYSSSHHTTTPIAIGPLGPWLQLETIHSIVTLLLQSMDLLDGGRNPWETTKDLWSKLQREFARWEALMCHEEKQQGLDSK